MRSLNIYFTGPQEVNVVEEDVRDPGEDEILIRGSKSLISMGTELICYARNVEPGSHWDNWIQYPFAPGYSYAGMIQAVGEKVRDLAPGMRVATRTSHRQYVICRASSALPIPDGVSDEEAAWFGIASIVQNGVRRAEHSLGDAVVVIGLGMLGQLVTQYTRLSGTSEVIAIDLSETRLGIAQRHGATHTLNMPVQEARQEVERLTGGRLADVVYDVTGFAPVFPNALRLARTLGKIVLLGDSSAPAQQHLTSDLITRGLRVIGAHDANPPHAATEHAWWTHPNMQRLFFKYVERGQMKVSDLTTSRRDPHEAQAAYADLLRDRSQALGTFFDWTAL
ncbi:MAG TPA: zinc-binding alcohol dehydrogenase [Armatimonadota bacterium]|nr:zinc-binding alcohol dehydrogenase [Armatimonadota bacterium]